MPDNLYGLVLLGAVFGGLLGAAAVLFVLRVTILERVARAAREVVFWLEAGRALGGKVNPNVSAVDELIIACRILEAMTFNVALPFPKLQRRKERGRDGAQSA